MDPGVSSERSVDSDASLCAYSSWEERVSSKGGDWEWPSSWLVSGGEESAGASESAERGISLASAALALDPDLERFLGGILMTTTKLDTVKVDVFDVDPRMRARCTQQRRQPLPSERVGRRRRCRNVHRTSLRHTIPSSPVPEQRDFSSRLTPYFPKQPPCRVCDVRVCAMRSPTPSQKYCFANTQPV